MFTVYSASAGSGKTYNLVHDYLAVCFRSQLPAFLKLHDKRHYVCPSCTGYRWTLAITFTNNAGAEMKERVVKNLNTLAFAKTVNDLDGNDFDNLSQKVFGAQTTLSAEERFVFLNENAKTLLHSILYDYARFSITTIDSFIQRVIRSSALYLNLSMSYAVQIRLTDFFRMAIEQYICELSQDKQQFEVVVKELSRQLEDMGSANINRFLIRGLGILYYDTEKSHPYVSNFPEMSDLLNVVSDWRHECPILLARCKQEVKPVAEAACLLFEAARNEGIEANGQKKWDEWFAKIADDPFNLEKGYDKSKIHTEMDENSVFKKGKANTEDLRISYAAQVKSLFEQIQKIVVKNATNYFTFQILSKNANHLLVLNSLRNHIENIKSQTDSFFLSESNPLLFDAIVSGKGDPLFEKMGFYRNFFIDEFQDTSKMQWEDMKPLIINALSDDEHRNGNVTLFGDVKQSIYRFRNGDAELFYRLSDFNRLKQTATEQDIVRVLDNDYHSEPLKVNYRSRSSVIEFNNAFFLHYSDKLAKSDYYADVEQGTREEKNGGLVQLLGYNKKDYRDIRLIWPDCTEDFYQKVYLELRPEEAELLYAVMDARRRGYAYGDMAVLLSGRAKCNTFAQCLMQADIPVITSESLQLCDNAAINLIISTLQLLLNPSDLLAQTVILHHFSQAKSLDFHHILTKNSSGQFASVMSEYFDIQNFNETMEQWIRNPFLVTLKDIVRFYGFSSEDDPFIADFMDLAVEYAQTQVASVSEFLTWWDDLNRYQETIPRLSLSGSSDAVRLMTIHASKGLEFPVVITHCTASRARESYYWVTDPNSGQSCYVKHEKNMQFSDFKDDYDTEEDKRALDALNLWYVDFTRARDMLYILMEFSDSKKSESDSVDVKKALRQFLTGENIKTGKKKVSMTDSGNNLYCYGDIDWTNPKSSVQEAVPKSDFRIACSGLDFCGNSSISVMSSESGSESADKGTLIHQFLQKLTHFPISENERRSFVEGCPEEIREGLLALFDRTERDPELRPYFYPDEADRVLNEASIILETGEIRRPDRIVFKPDHVMIIDYKTGREYRDKYEKQVAEYKDCLQKMGYSDVRTIILYTDENVTGGNS